VTTRATPVVVRPQIGDDPHQTPIAEQAFLAVIDSGGVYLTDVVLIDAVIDALELAGKGKRLPGGNRSAASW
jgi:hypothetical protein